MKYIHSYSLTHSLTFMYVDTSNITLAGYVENLVFTGSNKMEPSTLKFNYVVYYF